MASITIQRQWHEDDRISIVITADSSYPDALDQARVTAMAAFKEALAYTLAVEGTTIDEDSD